VPIIKITDAVRAAARRLLRDRGLKLKRSDRDALETIANGKRKQINGHWWSKIHGGVADQAKLDKLAEMADPARNSMAHERAVAAAMLKKFKGRGPPGLPPQGRPLPSMPPRSGTPPKHGGVNTKPKTDIKPKQVGGVNTKPKRTGDRHLNKGDRHAPGYMRDYMRRRRAAAKTRGRGGAWSAG
jgi:hypothetical protein